MIFKNLVLIISLNGKRKGNGACTVIPYLISNAKSVMYCFVQIKTEIETMCFMEVKNIHCKEIK